MKANEIHAEPRRRGADDGAEGAALHELSPLEELLLLHPAPWQALPHPGWRGEEPADELIYDARGHAIEADDSDWTAALVEAVNLASAVVGAVQELEIAEEENQPRMNADFHR